MVTQESALEADQSFVESCPAFFSPKSQNFHTVVKWATCAFSSCLHWTKCTGSLTLTSRVLTSRDPEVLAPLYFEILGFAALLLDLHFQVCTRMWIPQDEAWRRTWIHQNQGWIEDTAVHKVRKAWSENLKFFNIFSIQVCDRNRVYPWWFLCTVARTLLGTNNPWHLIWLKNTSTGFYFSSNSKVRL